MSLMPAKLEVGSDTKLGKKSSGVICGPAGNWYGRDLAIDREAVDLAVRDALETGGIRIAGGIAGFGEPVELARLRLRVRIVGYKLNACIPWKATRDLIGGRGFRGTGRLEAVWELYSADARAVIKSEEVTVDFTKVQADSQSELFAMVLKSNAAILARRWKDSCGR